MPIRRDDFKEVRPTTEEREAFLRKHPERKPWDLPYRAIHIPCGTRMWYSGIGIGSHLRKCEWYTNAAGETKKKGE